MATPVGCVVVCILAILASGWVSYVSQGNGQRSSGMGAADNGELRTSIMECRSAMRTVAYTVRLDVDFESRR